MRARLKINENLKLVEIGKIKIGEKNEKGYPTSLDYFKGYGKYAHLFDDAYPKQNKITIAFINDEDNYSCFETLTLRNKAGKVFAKCDMDVIKVYDSKEKIYKGYPYSEDFYNKCTQQVGKEWERTLTLRFVVPKVHGIIGTWRLETKADKSSIDNIIGTYDFVKQQAGTVNKILFDLTVDKVKSQKPDNPSSYPVLNLICNMTESNLKLIPEYVKSLHNEYVNDEAIKQLSTNNQKQLIT